MHSARLPKLLMQLKLVALSLLLCAATQAKTLEGKVTRVSDGDTLWVVASGQPKPIKIRLQGIDAPEICQPWGTQARDALRARLLRQSVSVDVRARDDYGRSIARLAYKNEDVAAWLVSQGHAWSLRGRWDEGVYAAEQAAAKRSKSGLWRAAGADQGIEPRAWRKTRGACTV
jgi:micrococcal nuclease